MTNYNDGRWHRWDDKEHPPGVHPLSLCCVYYITKGGYIVDMADRAINCSWPDVVSFRVTEHYAEPPETIKERVWVDPYQGRLLIYANDGYPGSVPVTLTATLVDGKIENVEAKMGHGD
jgi:hypothetical protein